MKIEESLVLFNVDVRSKEEIIETLAFKLFQNGFVTIDYIKDTIKREQLYPTGLPTKPYGIAVPHTGSETVINSKIAFANLKTPIPFKSMSNANEEIPVKIIFMLALNSSKGQIETIQKLMVLFRNEKIVEELGKVRNINDLKKLIKI